MAHSDDNGLILPPKIAPLHVVFIPIFRNDEERSAVLDYTQAIIKEIQKTKYHDENIRYELDDRDLTGGEKSWQWIKKGVPLRIEIGPKDMQNNAVYMGRRDKEPNEKCGIPKQEFIENIVALLDNIQANIFNKALQFRLDNTINIDTKEEFYKYFTAKNTEKPEIHGGFAMSHWCETEECETKIKEDLKVTIRCIPLEAKEEEGKCIICGKASKRRVVFAKAY
jgi:prolyl-tRNA synthetase